MGGFSPDAGLAPLVLALSRTAGAHPFERKVLVGPRRGIGRELLRQLSLGFGGWVQFEATTPRDLAGELVATALAERGLRVIDEFDELARIDDAIERAMRERVEVLRPFIEGAGLRDAMANSIRALRLAGIDAASLGRAGFRDRQKREAVGRVLDQYERLLAGSGTTDTAGMLRLAIGTLAVGAVRLPEARIVVLPGQGRRGLAGRLLELVLRNGGELLETDPVFGLPAPRSLLVPEPGLPLAAADDAVALRNRAAVVPGAFAVEKGGVNPALMASPLSWLNDVAFLPAGPLADVRLEIFSAGSVNDEVREVLRRVVGQGLAWDEVEVIATDPMTYGTAIDAIARRLGIPVSFAVGLPVGRTRPGRVVDAFLRWVRDDFPEDVLRELIERGDIAPPGGGSTGPALARRLQRMLIGRGRDRYEAALALAERSLLAPRHDDAERSAAEIQAAVATETRLLADLRAIIEPVFRALPRAMSGPAGAGTRPERAGAGRDSEAVTGPSPGGAERLVRPADLALSLIELLSMIPAGEAQAGGAPAGAGRESVDRTARQRIERRLRRLAETATRATSVEGAITMLATRLEDRVPAPVAEGGAPWASAGGRLHVADIEHGGWTGRRATFVVGLDATRFPGGTTHDTLLNDEDRRRLDRGAGFAPIPTAGERIEERRYALGLLLARLRGSVTLSYSAWEATEARTVAPAPELLQAFRLMRRNPALDYRQLHEEAFRRHASAIPRTEARLDNADVWFGALTRGGVLVSGMEVVRGAYPDLDRGLSAREARLDPAFSAWHGRIRPRPGLDPRENPDVIMSARRLETLGACPHRYLLRYVLGIVPPEERDFAPDRWLGPAQRGGLLHRVYERTLRLARDRGHEPADGAFAADALEVLDAEIDRMRERLEPPGEAVFELERDALRDEVGLFVSMTRSVGARWHRLEYRFGLGGGEPVGIELPGGRISLAGAIDRIDFDDEDNLVVIDYKTGSPADFGRGHGVFDGGRRLQHALYAAAARRRLGAHVVRAEYHFPTNRGEVRRASFEERRLRRARRIIDVLLDIVQAGHFFPTDDARDCRWCDFRAVCRVRDGRTTPVSPMAEWARTARERLPELRVLRQLREETG